MLRAALLLTGISIVACGGRTLAADPIFEEYPPDVGGRGGAPSAGKPGTEAGTPAGARAGRGGAPTAGMPSRPGTAGRAGSPGTGASTGVGGNWGLAGFGAFPGVGGAVPIGAAGGRAPVGGSAGVGGVSPGECKSFCASLRNACLGDVDVPSCFDNCYSSLTSPGGACRTETIQAMRCVTKALQSVPNNSCEGREAIALLCAGELFAVDACREGTTCSESGSSGIDSCALLRECGPTNYSVFECKLGPDGLTTCSCWMNGALTSSFPVMYPAEKACFEPSFSSVCQPPNIF